MRRAMIRPVLAMVALFAAVPAGAATDLSVLPQGRYGCWTAGVATGPATIGNPERSFTIVRGSSYESMAGGGTYLLASDLLTFTRGPFKDLRLRKSKDGYWQQIARDGEFAALKCSRLGAAPTA